MPEQTLTDAATDMLALSLDEKATADERRAAAITLVEIVAPDLLASGRTKWPQFIYTHNGSRVLRCDCGKLYDEDAVDAYPYFICECGKLGQRMDEADITPINPTTEPISDSTT